MLLLTFYIILLILPFPSSTASIPCPCGWKLRSGNEHFTHHLYNDFSKFSRREDLSRDWLINGYFRQSDNLAIRLNQQFGVQNVQVNRGLLNLKQPGYSDEDMRQNKAISIAGVQSKALEILHGSFRTVMKIEGATGGAVGSFFWYHNDSSEIDIEAITRGTSIVNNTINYTSHPSTYTNGTPIANATRSIPLDSTENILRTFRQHRFDCHPQYGTKYYLDDRVVHVDSHNIPSSPGNVQLLLWADGNRWWSGKPSTTDVIMSVKSIEVYYNTSGSDGGESGTEWFEACQQAGGPGEATVCEEGTVLQEDDPNTWILSPSMSGGGNEIGLWRTIGKEILVGALLAEVVAWTLL